MKTNFSISIIHDTHSYTYKIKLLQITSREEIYQLTAGNKTVNFANNRPLLKSKKLKHWKMTWKTDKEIWNVAFKKLITDAIEKEINLH